MGNLMTYCDFRILLMVSAIGLVGCGQSVESVPVTPVAPPTAKALLTDVANTGELGSIASSIRDALTELQKTDAAKADELIKELDVLETLDDPAKIKAKASAMAAKL